MTFPRVDPGYPYERLTPETVANIQRLRDTQMRALRYENELLTNELYRIKQRLDQILRLVGEMGIDIDVMLATEEAFKSPSAARKASNEFVIVCDPHQVAAVGT